MCQRRMFSNLTSIWLMWRVLEAIDAQALGLMGLREVPSYCFSVWMPQGESAVPHSSMQSVSISLEF